MLRPVDEALACAWLCALPMAVLAASATAAAQEGACHGTGLDFSGELRITPPAGASEVARDAPVVLSYPPEVDVDALAAALDPSDVCRGELACLLVPAVSASSPPRPIASTIERLDPRTFVVRAAALLPARQPLLLLYARPGFDRPTRGEVAFETSSDVDREPPTLQTSAEELELLIEPPPGPCDAPAGSLRVRLSVPTPEDDGDPMSVEVLAYARAVGRDRGREATSEPAALRARARPEEPDQETLTLTLFLTPEEAQGRVCVALRAVDGVGRRSERTTETCFDPAAAERAVFAPSCAARAPGPPFGCADSLARGLLLLLAAALARRRTR